MANSWANSAVLLDLILSAREGQNQDWVNFSTLSPRKSGPSVANMPG